jgi:glycosyltransferase involved in cell wall biosynthesis
MLQWDEEGTSSTTLEVLSEPDLERPQNGSSRPLGARHPVPSLPQLGPRVSVVIPAMNEAENLPYAFSRLPEGLHEVILVDGHSVDDTVAVAERLRPDVRIVTQSGKGKGNAMADGFAACTGDIIVMLDADGSTDPDEIPAFVGLLLAGADFVKGSRFLPGAGTRDMPRFRQWGNAALTWLVRLLFGGRYTDLCYGYNAFWADVLPELDLPEISLPTPAQGGMLWGDGFEIETVLNCRVAAAGLAIMEVPSVERARIFGKPNLRTFTDGFRVLVTIMTEWRRHRRATPEPAFVLTGDVLAEEVTA